LNIELPRAEYAAGGSIESVLVEIHERITQRGDDAVGMHLEAREECLTSLPTDRSLPVFGVPFAVKGSNLIPLALVGAHLFGQPLNVQLTERNSRLLCTTRTATHYKLFALQHYAAKVGPRVQPKLYRPGNRSRALGAYAGSFGRARGAGSSPNGHKHARIGGWLDV
jgi:hypothetical protein